MSQRSSPDALQELIPPIGTVAPTKNTRTPRQIDDQQRTDAAARRKRTAVAVVEPAAPPAPRPSALVLPAADDDNYIDRYLNALAPDIFPGRRIQFNGKIGEFRFADDDSAVDPTRDFVALLDETLHGWIRFNGPGVAPDTKQGLLYGVPPFRPPLRGSLSDPDPDPASWPMGLNGELQDPWLFQLRVVLEDRSTNQLFQFSTTTPTGRAGVARLLRDYERTKRAGAHSYPAVRLKPGGYHDKKHPQRGWIPTPEFAIVGRAPKDGATKPDTSLATDMNDEIPRFDK